MKALTTRRLAIIGILGGISVLLGVTQLGFIRIGTMALTIMHIPVLLGTMLEGPLVGGFTALIFGVSSLLTALLAPSSPLDYMYINPLVSVLPRLLIVPFTYWTYRSIRHITRRWTPNRHMAGEMAALTGGTIVGTLTNTVFVLLMCGLIYLQGFASAMGMAESTVAGTLAGIGVANGLPETALAVLIVLPVARALLAMRDRRAPAEAASNPQAGKKHLKDD